MIPNYSLPKLSCFLLAALFFAASCSKNIDKITGPGGGGGGGNSDSSVSLTTPVGHTGDVPFGPDPDPVPQVSEKFTPFAGVWKTTDIVLVFLNDGRAACLNSSQDAVPAEVGTYNVDNGRIELKWMFSDAEKHNVSVNGNTLTLYIYDFQRTGDDQSAATKYNQIYQDLVSESDRLAHNFPVGKVTNAASDPQDPSPTRVIKGANVYTGNGLHFLEAFYSTKWYQLPDNKINGYDGYSRADIWLLPNGRFCSEMWLWKGVDDHSYARTNTLHIN